MFNKTSREEWETKVQQQLKTDDIYSVLMKDNLEGLTVQPYEDEVAVVLPNLPKVEEATQLVAAYDSSADENTFAFLLDRNVEDLLEKTLFINNAELAEHISLEESNRYLSLIDVFSDETDGELNVELGRALIEKDFERTIAVDVALHQNAGASIIQQLGAALAKTKELTEEFGPEILNKMIIRIAVGGNYFFEVAKIRALKIVFNTFSKEFNLNEIPYIFAETSFRNKSLHDPENNLIRSTLELSAAMIGGADAVYSNDYLLGGGGRLSQEISFKQQIVLAYESIINVFDDAANGSYAVEDLTRQIAGKAWDYFLEIEEKGGYCAVLRNKTYQKQVYDHALEEQQWAAEGKLKIVGVNLYPLRPATKKAEQMYDAELLRPVRLAEMFE